MTCSLYAGTLVYHPGCSTGYSYYYNSCCNVKWYYAWNVIMWVFIIAAIVLVSLVIIKYNRRTQLRKKAKFSAY